MYLASFSEVKLIFLSDRTFLYIKNYRSISNEVIGAYFAIDVIRLVSTESSFYRLYAIADKLSTSKLSVDR
jgi:hypothetical protein